MKNKLFFKMSALCTGDGFTVRWKFCCVDIFVARRAVIFFVEVEVYRRKSVFDSLPLNEKANVAAMCGENGVETSDDQWSPLTRKDDRYIVC